MNREIIRQDWGKEKEKKKKERKEIVKEEERCFGKRMLWRNARTVNRIQFWWLRFRYYFAWFCSKFRLIKGEIKGNSEIGAFDRIIKTEEDVNDKRARSEEDEEEDDEEEEKEEDEEEEEEEELDEKNKEKRNQRRRDLFGEKFEANE